MEHSAIRAMRTARGMTLQDVADKVGTTAVTVSRWEREPSRVTVPVLARLAVALNCSVRELVETDAGKGADQYMPIPHLGDPAGRSYVWDSKAFAAILGAKPEDMAVFWSRGDVMHPTISTGDPCYVDVSQTDPVRPGVYIIQGENELIIRRLMPSVSSPGMICVTSDNPLYRLNELVKAGDLQVKGRVILVERKI